MTLDTFEKLGVVGALSLFIGNLFHKKDIQQNNQNDLLVQNLIESNKNLTEKFEIVIQLLHKQAINNAEQSRVSTQIIKLLEEQNKNKKRNRRAKK